MSFSLWVYVTIFAIFILLLRMLLQHLHSDWSYDMIKALWNVPGPKGTPIFGAVGLFRGTPEEIWKILRQKAFEYPKLYKVWAFYYANILVFNPEDMEKIMTSSKMIKKCKIYSLLYPWLNTGLLTSDGEKWHLRRKLLTPAFHFNILREFVNIFEEHSFEAVEHLRSECDKDSTDVMPFVTEFALRTLCETTMGYKIEPKSQKFDDYKNAIHTFTSTLMHRIFRPWLFPDFIFALTTYGAKIRRTLKVLHKFTSDIIDERLKNWEEVSPNLIESASGKQRCAMLDLLIMQMKEGANIDFEGLREEVDTFMFEGHDTTSTALLFLLFTLANHPEVQEKILEELQGIFGSEIRKASYEDLQSMNYLDLCIKETLRLFPPVNYISRETSEDVVLQNHKLPSGVSLHLMIYDLHHNPEIWPEPSKFIPERFTPENSAQRHPFAYIPFSAGYRNCIGQRFAMLEIKSFISKILWEYKLESTVDFDKVILKQDIILRAKNASFIRFRPRY